ncbi:hypothetical protein Tco_1491769 [Tanacetum coccineum]
MIMVVPLLNGEGHTLEKMVVEYEWTPPCCMECHVFGHTSQECPKTQSGKEVPKTQSDGFTTVQNRKNRGKNVDSDQPRHIEGIKLTKPKPKYVWSVKSSQPAAKSKTNTKDVNNMVKLRNKFTALQDKDEVFTLQDACESSSVKKNVGYSEQDAQSDSEVEEMASEYGSKVVTQKGESTPSEESPNV